MKKAKIMLTAITVLAIAGGVLAFKAKTFNQVCYYSSTTTHTGGTGDYCTYVAQRGTTIVETPNTPLTYATTIEAPAFGPCPTDIPLTCTELSSTAVEPGS
jgi:hypothetical protein